jgi:uncharacterized DUF497 family protein
LDWDAAKSDRNLAQRGFDFEFASQIFAATYAEASPPGDDEDAVEVAR